MTEISHFSPMWIICFSSSEEQSVAMTYITMVKLHVLQCLSTVTTDCLCAWYEINHLLEEILCTVNNSRTNLHVILYVFRLNYSLLSPRVQVIEEIMNRGRNTITNLHTSMCLTVSLSLSMSCVLSVCALPCKI